MSFSIHGKRFSDLSDVEILRHKNFHLGKLLGKVANICEALDHQEDRSIEPITREVIPDLIIYALQLANLYHVDLDHAFNERIAYVLGKHPGDSNETADFRALLGELSDALEIES